MTPEERKARNRLWRLVARMVERWESEDGVSSAQCARELREVLSLDPPKPPGRPRDYPGS